MKIQGIEWYRCGEICPLSTLTPRDPVSLGLKQKEGRQSLMVHCMDSSAVFGCEAACYAGANFYLVCVLVTLKRAHSSCMLEDAESN